MANSIVFIDARVQDNEFLISQLSPETEYHIIDADHDGIGQLVDFLSGKSGYDSIQIISHGAPGSISIGDTVLNNATLNIYSSQLSQIGHSLQDGGDLLLYGCNVGAGVDGLNFIQTLSQMTGADVAASNDMTGGNAVGGDWELEASTGKIEAALLAVQNYAHSLGDVDDFILAKMSLVAYFDDPNHPDEKEPTKGVAQNAWEELKAEGWKILQNTGGDNWAFTKTPKHPTFEDTQWWGFNSGFSATVFGKDDEIVIAYRGTNQLLDLNADREVASIVPNAWDLQFSDALKVAQIISYLYKNAHVEVTGHSLGGSLAQVASQMFGFSGTTFDPAGAKNLVGGMYFAAIAKKLGIEPEGKGVPDDFTNYLVEGSPISGIPFSTKDHLGNTEIYQKINLMDFLNSYYQDDLAKQVKTILSAGVYTAVDYTLYKHEMVGLLEYMRQRVGADGVHYYGTSGIDHINANAVANEINGYGGDDSILSWAGYDTITGGAGCDSIDGGAGMDIAIFSGAFSDYNISLKKEGLVFTVSDTVDGRDESDTLTGVEYFQFADGTRAAGDTCKIVYGSSQGELIYGNDLDNVLYGSAENDVLEGKRGNDTIDGGIGSDTVIFSGNYSDYTISRSTGSSTYIVTDKLGGRDGIDEVRDVESFRFADGMRSVGELTDDSSRGSADGAGIYHVGSSTQMFRGHSLGEWSNSLAFAALRTDGSVVTWGATNFGGDSNSVSSKLNGDVDVVQLFSTCNAFAALRSDGSVVTWGGEAYGGDSSLVSSKLNGDVDVEYVFSTGDAFAALRTDGSLVTWGYGAFGGDSSAVSSKLNGEVDVVRTFSTDGAFAALREDGSVVTWGFRDFGGDSSAVSSLLDGTVDVANVFSTYYAFAALRIDGTVVTWGGTYFGGPYAYGGDSSSVSSQLNGTVDVVKVYSTYYAFAALREDGSVVTWGYDNYSHSNYGGDSSSVSSQLNGNVDVVKVCSTSRAFAALREDGSVVSWGHSNYSNNFGGDSSAVSNELDGEVAVVDVFATDFAFAALREDGSVVTWGDSSYGGDSSSVSNQLDGAVDVVKVFSTSRAFAALLEDGSVVTWGGGVYGGDSSTVSNELNGDLDVVDVFSTSRAFAALLEDGSVVTWGDSSYGGDNSAVVDELHDVVAISDIYSNNTAGRIHDGSDNDDQINGNYTDDELWGNGGNDVLAGMAGDDLVFGGDGNDFLICGEGEGNDTYDGGDGIDTVKYLSALAGITVDLAEGTAYATDGNDAAGIGIDTLINIENIVAGNFDDLLIGNAFANSIEGGLGNDTLAGGEGADTLDGGSGLDTADFSDKSLPVVVALNGSTDAIVSVGGVAEDTIRNIENLIGGDGNDFFTGDSADNIFRGGAGGDTLDGSAGSDTADYSEKSEAVVAALHGASDASVMVGGVAEDTIRNIENLIGGSGDDHFIGDAAANMLSGNAGDDLLEGGAGNDTLIGGFGVDTAVFSGNVADYKLSYDQFTDTVTVMDKVSDRDGLDVVKGVQHLRFADATWDTNALFDTVAPSLSGITPTGYANDVPLDSATVLTFTEEVQAGTGLIRLVSGGATIQSIDITDSSQVHIDGHTLTIDPSENLSFKTSYQLQIDPGAVTILPVTILPDFRTTNSRP